MKNAQKKKALVITHAGEMWDSSRAAKRNIEDFIGNNQDYDIIRIRHPLTDDYISNGYVIHSETGIIPSEQALKLISKYNTIVTAGGYFNDCALNTFKSLASAYYQNPSSEIKIIIPLSLLYQPVFYQDCSGPNPEETKTVEEIFKSSNDGKRNNASWLFKKRLHEMEKRAQFWRLMNKNFSSRDIESKATKNEVVARDSGLILKSLISHKEISNCL